MRPWFWTIWLLTLFGCAKQQSADLALPSVIDDFSTAPEDAYEDVLAVESEREWGQAKRARISAGRSAPPAPPPPAATLEPVTPAPERMVHYNGYARMRSTRPRETLDAIAKLATDAEGRVDRLTDTQATIRVPEARFDEVWLAVLELGDVLVKRVRADDVTDQFRATDLRVRTLREMQKRLVRLLSRARSEEEKLALLQEITRVTEELDRTESQLRALRDLAEMSEISVDVVPRELDLVGRGGVTWRSI
ncbi:MAG: DUF4349 domain-containing protein [Myxococcota bacterium]